MEALDRLAANLRGMVTVLGVVTGGPGPLRACRIVEPRELGGDALPSLSDEVVLLIGQTPAQLAEGLRLLAPSEPGLVMAKAADARELHRVAKRAGIERIALVHHDVPWGQLHGLVERILASAAEPAEAGGELDRPQPADLFAIANSLADQLGGYVSIDDAHSRVMAFSPLDERADELRRASILGRAAPPGHREQLREQGVWDQLRVPGRVVELAAEGEIRARLAVGIVDPRSESYLGTIWVQEGAEPFRERARQVLVAAGRLVARTMVRADQVASRDSEAVLQLIGVRRGTESRRTLLAMLGLATAGSWLVVGFAASAAVSFGPSVAASLGLYAASLRGAAQVAVADRVAYVVIADPPEPGYLREWGDRAAQALGVQARGGVVCALGPVSAAPRELRWAREAVDAMLRGAIEKGESGVATYESQRAQLQVSRSIQALWDAGLLTGEPVAAVLASGYVDGRELIRTVEVYFAENRSAHDAAAALHLHPNTLRQRLRRVERLAGLSLAVSEERLLLELEVRAYREGLSRG